jgi:alpha-L-fucosidase
MTTTTRRGFLHTAATAAVSLASASAAAPPPMAPYGTLPSDRQWAWHQLETYGFLHFSVNTFTDKEWGYGDEDPSIFNPTALDADQMVEALAAGGMKGVILTCKHHDGFCLWPSKTTKHSVAASSWRGGKGDVVREVSQAAARRGLKFGVYLSPWDRNNAAYARPEYVVTYREQLRELLTGYGEIFEVWHDGANGGDGYYGGAREKRLIDKHTYYEWPKTWEMVRALQPGAVVFSDLGPDIRWVGNEQGWAAETSWATYDPVGQNGDVPAPGYTRYRDGLEGTRNGSHWLPAECDVSIRPGWFWHEKQNARVKTPRQLMDLYYKSVGRGASFLLNVPPDRRGHLHEADVASLKAFGTALADTFKENAAAGARIKASDVRGKDRRFAPSNLVDGDRTTVWATGDAMRAPEVTVDLGRIRTFDLIRIREDIRLGQRIEGVAVDQWKDGEWAEFAKATSIGNCRLIRLGQPVTTSRVRLRITATAAAPVLSEFGLYTESVAG